MSGKLTHVILGIILSLVLTTGVAVVIATLTDNQRGIINEGDPPARGDI